MGSSLRRWLDCKRGIVRTKDGKPLRAADLSDEAERGYELESRFVCRTCGTQGPFYVARQVTNWTQLEQPWRTPSGSLTYRTLNVYLLGKTGPPLAFYCGHCRSTCDTLEELVMEPAFVRSRDDSLPGGRR